MDRFADLGWHMFALASAVKQLFSRKRPAEDELIDNPSQRARTTMAPSDEASVANEEAPEVEAAVTVASAVESGSDAERESAEQEDDEDEDEDEARDLGIAPSSLPTLSQAYASNDLTPSEQQLSAHDARLNDIVSILSVFVISSSSSSPRHVAYSALSTLDTVEVISLSWRRMRSSTPRTRACSEVGEVSFFLSFPPLRFERC